jgi:hypothetical protein
MGSNDKKEKQFLALGIIGIGRVGIAGAGHSPGQLGGLSFYHTASCAIDTAGLAMNGKTHLLYISHNGVYSAPIKSYEEVKNDHTNA